MGKGIFENHCTYGHADASYRRFTNPHLYSLGLGEGPWQGDTLERKNITSSTRVNKDIFSFAGCNEIMGFHFCNSLDMQHVLKGAYSEYAQQHY